MALGYAATPDPAAGGSARPASAPMTTLPAAAPKAVKPAAGEPKPLPAVAKSPAPVRPAPVKMAAAAPAMPKAAARAMLYRPSTPSPVGSASWIAQLLAALGGAIAAGLVAWFLIRPAPRRHYG